MPALIPIDGEGCSWVAVFLIRKQQAVVAKWQVLEVRGTRRGGAQILRGEGGKMQVPLGLTQLRRSWQREPFMNGEGSLRRDAADGAGFGER